VPAIGERVANRSAANPDGPRHAGRDVERLGQHRRIGAGIDNARPVVVGASGLGAGDEARSHPHGVGSQHQRGCDAAAVGNAARRDHRYRRDRVDDGGYERQGRTHVPRVAAGLGSLRHDHVDAGVDGLTRVGNGSNLAEHRGVRAPCRLHEGRRIGEGVGDDADAGFDRDVHELRSAGEVADEPDAEGTFGQIACPFYLVAQPRGAAHRRPADHAEPARLGHAGGERRRAHPAAHRGVQYRMFDPEPLTETSVQHGATLSPR
jgi:hypothetical protein